MEMKNFSTQMKHSNDSAMIESLSSFMRKLNDEKNSLVVVEGVRDARALQSAGFLGELFMLCHHPKTLTLEEESQKFEKIILLLDNDSEGRKLAERTQRLLKVSFDMYYQRALLPASKGKIRHVEELAKYADSVSLAVARV